LVVVLVQTRAGDLNPPKGPVAETMKPLSLVEPREPITLEDFCPDEGYTIWMSGSYYLAESIPGVAVGIKITAPNVALDLMGFELSVTGGDGIYAMGLQGITIRNGIVASCGGDGIDLNGSANARLQDLLITLNTGAGIIADSNAQIRDCTVFMNGQGIDVESGSLVADCVAAENAGSGIDATFGRIIRSCVVRLNNGKGILTLDASIVSECSVTNSLFTGVDVNLGCVVSSSFSMSNGTNGIHASDGCSIFNCVGRNNSTDGLRASQSTMVNCATSINGRDGISGSGGGCLVSHSSSHGNLNEEYLGVSTAAHND
jgi:hypothetical protein